MEPNEAFSNQSSVVADGIFEIAAIAESQDDLLSHAVDYIKTQIDVESCDVLLKTSSGGLVLAACSELPEMAGRLRLGPGIGLASIVMSTREPLSVANNLLDDKRYAAHPGIDELNYESVYAVPIAFKADPLGVIFLRRTMPWTPTEVEALTLQTYGKALAISMILLNQGTVYGQAGGRIGLASEVAQTLAQSPYLEEILQLLVTMTAQRFKYRVVTVRLLDDRRKELVLRATQATHKAYRRKRAIKLGESIAGKAIKEKKTLIVHDVQQESDYIGHDLAEAQGLRSMICVPLLVQGKGIGVLTCYTAKKRDFPDDEIAALELLAKQAAISIEHAKLQVRNTLLQEMHHRVKNNLHQIGSLLRLQMRQSHYKTLEEALTDTLARILAIATVHELLSRDDLDHVDVRSIAEMLVNHQQQSLLLPNKQIKFQIKGDEVYLETNQATQVALILNELISNAIEHGFKESSFGEIHVSIESLGEDVRIFCGNNGDQLPPDFDKSKGQLGLQIVDSLSRSLGGTFSMKQDGDWAVAEILFPVRTGE